MEVVSPMEVVKPMELVEPMEVDEPIQVVAHSFSSLSEVQKLFLGPLPLSSSAPSYSSFV